MIKNRSFQLLFQTAYCTLGLVAVAASLGLFDMSYHWDFYIFFTNLSNYFCIGVMFTELKQTLKKSENSFVTVHPLLKFVGMLGILLTFLVFNILLANASDRDPRDNFKVSSVLLHIVLPIMYTADWILFYKKGKVKVSYPFLSMIFPLSYLAYIYTHAAIRHFDSSVMNTGGVTPLIYPYFFLNPEKSGVFGVVKWCLALIVLFAVGGFLFMGIDKVLGKIKGETKSA